ncbi:MAG TPA: hypothetical protein EYP85_04650 [Armatimonadetes bacterium]|nr:hypothetical protein [Armatimonadota bacterium]
MTSGFSAEECRENSLLKGAQTTIGNLLLLGLGCLCLLLSLEAWSDSARAAESVPRPEHPRPDFRREAWVNLNGRWAFDFDPKDVGEKEEWFRAHAFTRTIVVPYPWEAPLSGIADAEYQGAAWYQREFTVPAEWARQRVVLKFGAVDWEAKVWVNGEFVGEHVGGYSPFEFDLPDRVTPGQTAILTVRAFDRTSPEQPNGKQTGWYTRTSGIWQTVWLEARPATYLRQVHIVPRFARSQVQFRLTIESAAAGEASLLLETDPEEPTSAPLPRTERLLRLPAGRSEHAFVVDLPTPRPWSPDTPDLYFVRLTLTPQQPGGAGPPDVVHTYFGLRDIGVGRFAGQPFSYLTLNGKPIYLRGALNQAFHPEGIYTYPSDEVARQDLERAKEFGLNFLRLHIKVDDPRFLYWADRLGVLLMCDMPNFQHYTPTARANWEQTLRDAIARDFNHPSIFAWCLFNETWGLGGREYRGRPDRHAWVREMYALAKKLDPTRLVEDNSACLYDHVVTDINSWHFYINDYDAARRHIAEVVARTYPGSTFNFAAGWQQGEQPLLNSEYGGISAGAGDQDISWCFKYLTNELRKHAKICGYVYTELMDIEWEHNGFMNYDRTVKEFGYEEVSAGFSLRDLNSPDFLVIDSPPCPTVRPGSEFTVGLMMSHFSGREVQRPLLRWRLDGLDAWGRWREGLRAGEREVSFAPWTVTPLPRITFSLPPERLVATLTCWVEDRGEILARNYLNLNITEGPLSRRECPDSQTCVLRWQPGEIAATSWIRLSLNAPRRPEKVWGLGSGYVEYRLHLPEGLPLTELTGAELLFEAAAKAASEKVEWNRYKEVDYPQTDRTKWPTTVRVSLNGHEVQTLTLPDDPADARGVLSHAAKFHPGSYGYWQRIQVPKEVLRVLRSELGREPVLTLRFEVPEDAVHVGGFALFGDGLGRYPADPTLILRFGVPFDPAQVRGDGSSVAERGGGAHIILPTGEDEGQTWRYTTTPPPEDWTAVDFDDAGWAEGLSGFGREGTPNTFVRTPWHTADIWLRRTFTLPAPIVAAVLRYYHDEDMEVYLNGHLILQRTGYITNYREADLMPETLAHFRVGENVLAVHCHQTVGGQYADVGLRVLLPSVP